MPMTDAYAEAVLADGPVGYWRLNELTHVERVADESGHNHNGRFVGCPSLGEQGAIQQNPNCSMSPASEAHIEIPHSTEFSIQTSGEGLSVEVWMRPDTLLYEGEGNKKYIHWLGKGEPERMEWGIPAHSTTIPSVPSEYRRMPGTLKAAKAPVPITKVISSPKENGFIWSLASSITLIRA